MSKPKITAYKKGMFVFNKEASDLMKLNDDYLIARINYGKKKFYLEKDETPDNDSYRVLNKKGMCYFTSINLLRWLINCFDLKIEVSQRFVLTETSKGFLLNKIDE